MSFQGTKTHDEIDNLPSLVRRAVDAAGRHGFEFSCRPEQGRLLQVLAGGARRRIGETGTGCGVGLAWLASGAADGVDLVSVERDPERAAIAAEVFENHDRVEVVRGEWQRIADYGPYDLLILDGGGQGKDGAAADPVQLLNPGGVVVIDDFTPTTTWPPLYDGSPDVARLHWLEHPDLHATELRLAPDFSVVVGTYVPAHR
ncbi:class I SAM-dependent methyltransferase [Allokutzneria sp. A3M-2-11 16]|uniref:O-methyltransferase n=1 Tax=Allokutzneria sp. A3M-2-11 16 TaxID=2962043 RepID=UPI0020B80D2C|nr:class I SAM-dependent methyltransferase [Allokutzneria sp. A3M-2-11 16]MCP3798428.1 class I SAM-dependent methyltransferase [Allokutzneria sp. A3M-2-11 16]